MKTNRTLAKEQYPWLDADIPAGTTLYPYNKPTYGCIGDGIAVSLTGENQEPFLEVPGEAIEGEIR